MDYIQFKLRYFYIVVDIVLFEVLYCYFWGLLYNFCKLILDNMVGYNCKLRLIQ